MPQRAAANSNPTGQAMLSVSSPSLSFGNVPVGTATAQLVSVTNTGSANLLSRPCPRRDGLRHKRLREHDAGSESIADDGRKFRPGRAWKRYGHSARIQQRRELHGASWIVGNGNHGERVGALRNAVLDAQHVSSDRLLYLSQRCFGRPLCEVEFVAWIRTRVTRIRAWRAAPIFMLSLPWTSTMLRERFSNEVEVVIP